MNSEEGGIRQRLEGLGRMRSTRSNGHYELKDSVLSVYDWQDADEPLLVDWTMIRKLFVFSWNRSGQLGVRLSVQNIAELEIYGYRLTAEQVGQIAECSQLKTLRFDVCETQEGALAYLRSDSCSSLILNFVNTVSTVDLAHDRFPMLRRLKLDYTRSIAAGAEFYHPSVEQLVVLGLNARKLDRFKLYVAERDLSAVLSTNFWPNHAKFIQLLVLPDAIVELGTGRDRHRDGVAVQRQNERRAAFDEILGPWWPHIPFNRRLEAYTLLETAARVATNHEISVNPLFLAMVGLSNGWGISGPPALPPDLALSVRDDEPEVESLGHFDDRRARLPNPCLPATCTLCETHVRRGACGS